MPESNSDQCRRGHSKLDRNSKPAALNAALIYRKLWDYPQRNFGLAM